MLKFFRSINTLLSEVIWGPARGDCTRCVGSWPLTTGGPFPFLDEHQYLGSAELETDKYLMWAIAYAWQDRFAVFEIRQHTVVIFHVSMLLLLLLSVAEVWCRT